MYLPLNPLHELPLTDLRLEHFLDKCEPFIVQSDLSHSLDHRSSFLVLLILLYSADMISYLLLLNYGPISRHSIKNLKKGVNYVQIKDDDLGLVYIAEQVSPDDNTVLNLTYNDKPHAFYAEFDTILQSFRRLNRNKRMYLGPNIAENLKTERIRHLLATNGWYGEQDHPTQETENGKLTPERIKAIWMPNRSHKIMQPVVDGDLMRAKIQTASGTEVGRGMAMEIIQGLIPCFSCRALATLQMIDGKPTVIVRFIVTYDWVLFPSHPEAMVQGEAKFVDKVAQAVKESTDAAYTAAAEAVGKFKKFSESVCLPLKDVFSYIGEHDVNAQLIMESFDLDENAIVGISPDLNHVILRDESNQIYAKISPRTKKEVRDFLTSF